jgi:hypothetical protein
MGHKKLDSGDEQKRKRERERERESESERERKREKERKRERRECRIRWNHHMMIQQLQKRLPLHLEFETATEKL